MLLSACYVYLAVAVCVVLGASPGDMTHKDVRALIIVDPQTCISSSHHNISNPESLVPTINAIRTKYNTHWDYVFVSKNWNCPDQSSFTSTYPQINSNSIILHYNKKYELCTSDLVNTAYSVNCTIDEIAITIAQDLHPPYCLQNADTTQYLPGFQSSQRDIQITTGDVCSVGPFSLFWNYGGFLETNFRSQVMSRGINVLYFVGYGLEGRIMMSAQDAVNLGLRAYVVMDATLSSDPLNYDYYIERMLQEGIQLVYEDDINNSFEFNSELIANDLLMTSYASADPGSDWTYFHDQCRMIGGHICPLDHYCPFGAHSIPFLGFSEVGRWAPLADQRDWVYLSFDQLSPTCSRYSVVTGSFSSTVPGTNSIPYLCCKDFNLDTSPTTATPTDLPVGMSWQSALIIGCIVCFVVGSLLGVGGVFLFKKVRGSFVKEKDVNVT